MPWTHHRAPSGPLEQQCQLQQLMASRDSAGVLLEQQQQCTACNTSATIQFPNNNEAATQPFAMHLEASGHLPQDSHRPVAVSCGTVQGQWQPQEVKPETSCSSVVADSMADNASSILWPCWLDTSSSNGSTGNAGRCTDTSGATTDMAAATDAWLARVMGSTDKHAAVRASWQASSQQGAHARHDSQQGAHARHSSHGRISSSSSLHTVPDSSRTQANWSASSSNSNSAQGTAEQCLRSHTSIAALQQHACNQMVEGGSTDRSGNNADLRTHAAKCIEPPYVDRHVAGEGEANAGGTALSANGLICPPSCLTAAVMMAARQGQGSTASSSHGGSLLSPESSTRGLSLDGAGAGVMLMSACIATTVSAPALEVTPMNQLVRTPSKGLFKGIALHAPPSPMELLQAELMGEGAVEVDHQVQGAAIDHSGATDHGGAIDHSSAIDRRGAVDHTSAIDHTSLVAWEPGDMRDYTAAHIMQPDVEHTAQPMAQTGRNQLGTSWHPSNRMQYTAEEAEQQVLGAAAGHMMAGAWSTTAAHDTMTANTAGNSMKAGLGFGTHQMTESDRRWLLLSAAEQELSNSRDPANTLATVGTHEACVDASDMKQSDGHAFSIAAETDSDTSLCQSQQGQATLYSSEDGSSAHQQHKHQQQGAADVQLMVSMQSAAAAAAALLSSSNSSSSKCSHSDGGSEAKEWSFKQHAARTPVTLTDNNSICRPVGNHFECQLSTEHQVQPDMDATMACTAAVSSCASAGDGAVSSPQSSLLQNVIRALHCTASFTGGSEPHADRHGQQVGDGEGLQDMGHERPSSDDNGLHDTGSGQQSSAEDGLHNRTMGQQNRIGNVNLCPHMDVTPKAAGARSDCATDGAIQSAEGAQQHCNGTAQCTVVSKHWGSGSSSSESMVLGSCHEKASRCTANRQQPEPDSQAVLQAVAQGRPIPRMTVPNAPPLHLSHLTQAPPLAQHLNSQTAHTHLDAACHLLQTLIHQPLQQRQQQQQQQQMQQMQLRRDEASGIEKQLHRLLSPARLQHGSSMEQVKHGAGYSIPLPSLSWQPDSNCICPSTARQQCADAAVPSKLQSRSSWACGQVCQSASPLEFGGAVKDADGVLLGTTAAVMEGCHYDQLWGCLTSQAHVSLVSVDTQHSCTANTAPFTIGHQPAQLTEGMLCQQPQLTAGVPCQQEQLTRSQLQPAQQALANALHALTGPRKPAPKPAQARQHQGVGSLALDFQQQHSALQRDPGRVVAGNTVQHGSSTQKVHSACCSFSPEQCPRAKHVCAASPRGKFSSTRHLDLFATPTRSSRPACFIPSFQPPSARKAVPLDAISTDKCVMNVTMSLSLASVTFLCRSPQQQQHGRSGGSINIKPPSIRQPSSRSHTPASMAQHTNTSSSSSGGGGSNSQCMLASAQHWPQAKQQTAWGLSAVYDDNYCYQQQWLQAKQVPCSRLHGTLVAGHEPARNTEHCPRECNATHGSGGIALHVRPLQGKCSGGSAIGSSPTSSRWEDTAALGTQVQQIDTEPLDISPADNVTHTHCINNLKLQGISPAMNVSVMCDQTMIENANPAEIVSISCDHHSGDQRVPKNISPAKEQPVEVDTEARLQQHAQQGVEAAMACALLMQPGSSLHALLQEPATSEEMQQLQCFKQLVDHKQVLSPLERMQLWSTVERMLAVRLQSSQHAAPIPPELHQSCEWERTAPQATPARNLTCSAGKPEQQLSEVPGESAVAQPGAGTALQKQPCEGIAPNMQDLKGGGVPPTQPCGDQQPGVGVDDAVCQMHRVIAPNAMLAWAMDRDWAQLRL